jgi:hypothetical protein
MQTDRSLIEFARIVYPMYWLLGIDGAGMGRVHFQGVRSLELASAFLQPLGNQAIVLDQQSTHRDGHPAILVPVIMDRTALANLPTDRHQFVKLRFVN